MGKYALSRNRTIGTTVLRDVKQDVDARLTAAGILDKEDATGDGGEGGDSNAFSSTQLYGRALCSDGWTWAPHDKTSHETPGCFIF